MLMRNQAPNFDVIGVRDIHGFKCRFSFSDRSVSFIYCSVPGRGFWGMGLAYGGRWEMRNRCMTPEHQSCGITLILIIGGLKPQSRICMAFESK